MEKNDQFICPAVKKTKTAKHNNDQIKSTEKNPYHIFYDNYMNSGSSDTECTGLIPKGEDEPENWENYKDIFHFGG